MASSAQSTALNASTSTAVPAEELRPQAGPLPSKRGEIGYEERQDQTEGEGSSSSRDGQVDVAVTIPTRHPADRDASPDVVAPPGATPPPSGGAQPATNSATPTEVAPETSSTHSTSKRTIISFLKPKNVPSYGGLRLTTLVIFFVQILFAGGTIAAWALTAMRLDQMSHQAHSQSDSSAQSLAAGPSSIFIHVLFAIALLVQLLFLERRIFRLRVERYSFVHPGEILPSARRRALDSDMSIGLAPWQRPPLPTYAAALAQSGHGTGDVEDHIIAAPPPPAYGNTRGSTLLLTGFLRNSLRAQRPRSEHSQMSQQGDRPISYMSRDEQWEEVLDAERARRLEQTLARLDGSGADEGAVSEARV